MSANGHQRVSSAMHSQPAHTGTALVIPLLVLVCLFVDIKEVLFAIETSLVSWHESI